MTNKVVVVGVDNKLLKSEISETEIEVKYLKSIDDLMFHADERDLVIVDQQQFFVNEISNEKLYFLTDSAPCAIVISDYSKKLPEFLSTYTLEFIYDFEIGTGVFLKKIDNILINFRLNKNLNDMLSKIEEQKNLKEELMLREEVLVRERGINSVIVNSITSGLVIFDLEGLAIMVNESAQKIIWSESIGISIGSMYNAMPILIKDFVELLLSDRDTLKKKQTLVRKGSIGKFLIDIYAYYMYNDKNEMNGVMLLINDVTEQEEVNRLLFQSEKLATVGTMLSGIAHELRNPLSIISARVEMAKKKKKLTPEYIEKTLSTIEKQAERSSEIVNSLLNFTRDKATVSGFHNVEDIIDEAMNYITYQNVFDDIKVVRNFKNGLKVFGDRSRFVQVFLNLIGNAADAMNGVGTLTITSERASRGYSLVTFNDTGSGIDPVNQNKLFDPFFTTKDPGKGTGLGLAIVYKIVQQSNGQIWFESVPGNTTFFVKLPSKRKNNG